MTSTSSETGDVPLAGSDAAVGGRGRTVRPRLGILLGGLVLVALALRLPTAGEQSFWLDEVYTGRIVDGSLGHAWSTIQRTENTPPLFYLLDWVWGRAFGTGELALRSLSALAGALAVVPVVLLTREIGGRSGDAAARPVPVGVALAAGVLLAVNPLAHWFSQEARSYALFGLLAGAAWLALLRALDRPDPRRLGLWALAAVLVSWTHYFGALLALVGWGALVLAVRRRRTSGEDGGRGALRPLVVPGLATAVGVLAVAPIAKNQQSTDMYQAISQVKGLGTRLVETPKQFAIGYSAPAEYVVGGLLALVLVVLVVAAAWPRDGRATPATALLAMCAAVWVLPLVALAGGFDVVLTRNLVLLMPPLVVLAVLGAWRLGRRGWTALGVVGVVQLATIVLVAVTPVYQREDWRGLLRAAEDGRPAPELLFIGAYQGPAATYYSPTLRDAPLGRPVLVRSMAIADRLVDGDPLPRAETPQPPPGFRLAREEQRDQWRVFVWEAPQPTPISAELVQLLRTTPPRATLLRP